MPILELLADVDDVDPNLADNDGNTPLIFAAQAGENSADVQYYAMRNTQTYVRDSCERAGPVFVATN